MMAMMRVVVEIQLLECDKKARRACAIGVGLLLGGFLVRAGGVGGDPGDELYW